MARPFKEFLNDVRLALFYLSLTGSCVAAAIAGTYWGWWAYVWDIVLPIRVVGVVAITAAIFVVWHGSIFTSHYYFGVPKLNPLNPSPGIVGGPTVLPIRVDYVGNGEAEVFAMVTNEDHADTFAAQIVYVSGSHDFPTPGLALRWKGSDSAKQEILKGQSHQLHILKFVQDPASANLEKVNVYAPNGKKEQIAPKVILASPGQRAYEPILILFKVTSATSGDSRTFTVGVAGYTNNNKPETRVQISAHTD